MNEEYYIPDTNLFITDPERALTSWKPKEGSNKKNILVIPIPVLTELDKHKKIKDESGYAARESARAIKRLTEDGGNLSQGIEKNGITYISLNYNESELPKYVGYETNVDSYLIRLALKLKQEGKKVEIVTQDTTPYIVANSLGITVSDWKDAKAVNSIDQIYKGWDKLNLEEKLFTELTKRDNFIELNQFLDIIGYDKPVLPNMYFNIRNKDNNGAKLVFYANPFKSKSEGLVMENISNIHYDLKKKEFTRIPSLNTEQLMALHALSNENINTVFMLGRAGTGKTFLAIDSGYNQTYSEGSIQRYDKVLITRPVFEIGKEHGFLPGSIGEKYAPWAQPIIDNLVEIVHDQEEFRRLEEQKFTGIDSQIEIAPLAYARGTSKKNIFWIVDEAQNTTIHEMRTIGTRPAGNSKIVITGDPNQIDVPYINSTSCGLVYFNEQLKNYKNTATIFLDKVKRGPIAEMFSNH